FQAEDGIRDLHVTGVQTCALPICEDGIGRGLALVGEDAGDAALEAHRVGLAGAVHLDVQTPRKGVDDARAHAVQTTGGGVGAAAELPARVELGVDDLDASQTGAGLDVHGHATAGVSHLDGVVGVEDHRDRVAVPAQRFVDGVVEDL